MLQTAIHIAGLPALCYSVMRIDNSECTNRTTVRIYYCCPIGFLSLSYRFVVYLPVLLLYYYDYYSTTIGITGQLMMITKKVTTFACTTASESRPKHS